MNQEHARKIVGVAFSLFGVGWICRVTYPVVSGFWANDGDPPGVPFLFFVVPLMVAPGLLAVVFGVRFFKEFSESSVRFILGVFAFLLTFWLSSTLSTACSELLPEDVARFTFLFVSSLIVIPFYLFTVQWVLRYFTKTERTLLSLLSQWVVFLMACQLWLLLSSLFDEYSPRREGYEYLNQQPWGLVGLLVPIRHEMGGRSVQFVNTFN